MKTNFTEIKNELTKTFGGRDINTKYGPGTVLEIAPVEIDEINVNDAPELNITVNLAAGGTKTFAFSAAVNHGSITGEVTTEIADAFKKLSTCINKHVEAVNKAILVKEEAVKAEKLAQAAALRKQREELRFQLRKERALAKLEKLKPENTKKLFSTPVNYYQSLGWMAKHCRGIKAAMPDWMESQFVSMFGNVERYVVDSKKRTSGGFSYQWGLGLKVTFDQEVSGPLAKRATSKNKKIIDSVAFIWDLVGNYGFKFGKKQDIDQILDSVPDEYLDDFKKGYQM